MKKIRITLASGQEPDMQDCADILDGDLGLERVATLTDLTTHTSWMALARTDVLLVDEALILRDGFEPLNLLLSGHPRVHCLLILRNHNENKTIWSLMQGVRGVLTIGEIQPQLLKAISRLMNGEIWVSRRLLQPIRADVRHIDDGSYVYRQPKAIKEWVKWH